MFYLFFSRLFRLFENKTTQMWVNKELFMCGSDVCLSGLQGYYEPFILSFGEDEDGMNDLRLLFDLLILQ